MGITALEKILAHSWIIMSPKRYIYVLMTYKCTNQKVTVRIFRKSETKSRTKEEDKLYFEKMNYKSIHIQLIQTTCVVQKKKKILRKKI